MRDFTREQENKNFANFAAVFTGSFLLCVLLLPSAMPLRRQTPLMKRPTMATKATTKATKATAKVAKDKVEKGGVKGSLTNRRCLAILERVQKMCSIPKDVQKVFREAKRAAQSAKKGDHEKSASLLGTVMARVVNIFEEEQRIARDGLEKAKEEEKAISLQQLEAETQLKNAKQSVQDFKLKLKESNKSISIQSKALTAASAERKSAVQEVKLAEKECQHLQDVQVKTYQPLRESCAGSGSASRKQINMLCKAGQKVGFHQELLSIAPAVLKKELSRRQTFDQMVLKSMDSEFAKRSTALQSKLEDNQNNLNEQERAMEESREAVALAKETVKQTSRQIADAEAQVESSKKSVSQVKKKAKTLPSLLKQAGRKYEQASGKYAKFRSGPLATYLAYRPVRHVEDEDLEEEQEEEVEDDEEEATQKE